MHQFTAQDALKPWPAQKLQDLLHDLERHRPKGRAIAAFDADGTLWNTDLGEAFFSYKIENNLVPLPPDPWAHYNWLKKHESTTAAYVWLGTILKGRRVSQVKQWAEEAVAARPLPVFAEQRQILAKLKALDVEIYVVTASIKWAVEPGARRLGLSEDQVLGIQIATHDGIVGDHAAGTITYREGKIKALLEHTGGVAPYFSAGNTEGDRWLLEGATALRLVLASAPSGTENHPTESHMLAMAQQRGWHSHSYI